MSKARPNTVKGHRFRVERVVLDGEMRVVVVDPKRDVTLINRYLQNHVTYTTAQSYAAYLTVMLFYLSKHRLELIGLTVDRAQDFLAYHQQEVNRGTKGSAEKFLLGVCKRYWDFVWDSMTEEEQARHTRTGNPFARIEHLNKLARRQTDHELRKAQLTTGQMAPLNDEGGWRSFHFVEPEDLEVLLEACHHPAVRVLLQVLWGSDVPLGDRLSSTQRYGWLGVDWEDVDFAQCTLTVKGKGQQGTLKVEVPTRIIEQMGGLQPGVEDRTGPVWRWKKAQIPLDRQGMYGVLKSLQGKTGLRVTPTDFLHTVRLRTLLEQEQHHLAQMYLEDHRLICYKPFPKVSREEHLRELQGQLERFWARGEGKASPG